MIAAWIIVSVYFVIGAVATGIINKKKPEGAKERWTKYIFYLLIVFGMMTIIRFNLFSYFALAIFLVGLYEITKIGNGLTFVIGLVIYSVIASCFIKFPLITPWPQQLLIYVLVLTFDGFSQLTGQLFGKRKLVAYISPGKTIEGLIGGTIAAVLTAMAISYHTVQESIALGTAISITALIGDLLASFYKRKCGVKDYSKLIPGHGGVLDRFDSFIFVGACWFVTHNPLS